MASPIPGSTPEQVPREWAETNLGKICELFFDLDRHVITTRPIGRYTQALHP
jgi:hypothetical protein